MPEKNKKPEDSKNNVEQHNKSVSTSKVKQKVSKNSEKKFQKTGAKHDDWNDPTGNSHLSDK